MRSKRSKAIAPAAQGPPPRATARGRGAAARGRRPTTAWSRAAGTLPTHRATRRRRCVAVGAAARRAEEVVPYGRRGSPGTGGDGTAG